MSSGDSLLKGDAHEDSNTLSLTGDPMDSSNICSAQNGNVSVVVTSSHDGKTPNIPCCKQSSGEPIKNGSSNGRVHYNVNPDWASNAISLTGSSVEISLESLRNLYQNTHWDESKGLNPHPPDLSQIISIALKPNFSGEVDSRSIIQTEKIKEWNDKLASTDVTLFPQESQVPKGITTKFDPSDFHSEVESEKLDLEGTKNLWEKKYEELQKQDEQEKISKQRLSSVKQSRTSNHPVSIPPSSPVRQPESRPGESAIEREIRLAQEREAEIRKEHGAIKPVVQRTAPPKNTGIPGGVSDSIIENEVHQQQQREKQYHQELPHQKVKRNKEQEQSEYERQEKEQERLNAHESIIEREIRLQREREGELATRTSQHNHQRVPTSQSTPELKQVAEPVHPQRATSVQHTPAARPSPSMPAIYDSSVQQHADPVQSAGPQSPPHMHYEEAISTKAHAGESRIARELREQREREEELRAHWSALGVETPMVTSEPSDTPFNMPEPKQKPVVGPSAERSISKSESAYEVSSDSGERDEYKPHMHSSMSIDTGLFRVHRVAPLKAPVDAVDYPEDIRHSETPIEREIRVAREREEELRRLKGLPVESPAPKKQVMVSVAATPSPQPRKPASELRGGAQKLASSRIQKEIESQRSKELMLQNEGKIKSVSLDDVDHHKYVDIIPKEGGVAPPPPGSHREPSQSSRDTSIYAPSRGVMYSAPTFSNSPSSSINGSLPHSNHTNTTPPTNGTTTDHEADPSPPLTEAPAPQHTASPTEHKTNGTADVRNGANHTTQPPTQSEALPVNHVPQRSTSLYDPPKGQHYSIRRSQNPTGSRIEQELREMREREEELRRSHNMSPSDSSNADTESSHAAAILSSSSDPSEKGNKQRRHNLAAQWQKRIGKDTQ